MSQRRNQQYVFVDIVKNTLLLLRRFCLWIYLSENRQHCGIFLPQLFYIHNVCFAIQADFSVYKTVYDCKLLLQFLELLRICA